MVAWIKKHPKLLLLLADAMIVPGMLLCRWLTDNMLATNNPCFWTYFGAKCVTCGGTHFVNDLCNLRIWTALLDNPFLFALAVFFGVSFLCLNLWLVFGLPFFKKVLQKMYTLRVLFVWLAILVLFFFYRISPAFIWVYQTLQRLI